MQKINYENLEYLKNLFNDNNAWLASKKRQQATNHDMTEVKLLDE